MMIRRMLLVSMMVAAIGIGTTSSVNAHDPGTTYSYQPWAYQQGWCMGPAMNPVMCSGMMGQGMMNPGMMGQGTMNPGMMGQGTMNPGMMGQGTMNPGMMGQGMSPGTMRPLRQDLTVDDVKHALGHELEWSGNPNLKLGAVEDLDADTVIAEIVTQDGSLVQKLEVDRHTGSMQALQ
jgi:hypothetical protein